MTKRSRKRRAEKAAAKKATVLGSEKRRPLPLVALIALAAVLVCGVVLFIALRPKQASSLSGASAYDPSVSDVTYEAALFEDGKARHFGYTTSDGTSIRYFILKSSDEVIRAAFDACDVCWPHDKGYYQEGDTMVCRNCGRRFASHLINEVRGGCNPAPLARTVENGKVVIQVQDILPGRQYFDFAGLG